MTTKVCPNCGWRKDISTEVCHCGYDFVSGQMGTPAVAPTEVTTDNPQALVMASSEEKTEITSEAFETSSGSRSRSMKYFILWGLSLSLAVLFYFWAEATAGAGCFETCAFIILFLVAITVIITLIFAIYDFLSWLASRKGVSETPSPKLTDEERELRRKRRMRY